jgi:hypothetical protein
MPWWVEACEGQVSLVVCGQPTTQQDQRSLETWRVSPSLIYAVLAKYQRVPAGAKSSCLCSAAPLVSQFRLDTPNWIEDFCFFPPTHRPSFPSPPFTCSPRAACRSFATVPSIFHLAPIAKTASSPGPAQVANTSAHHDNLRCVHVSDLQLNCRPRQQPTCDQNCRVNVALL